MSVEYKPDGIVQSYVTEYMRAELKKNDGILKELEEYAQKHDVPIVSPETAKLISVLAHMIRPCNILEIGCAIGYSSIILAGALKEGGCITTLEYDPDAAQTARENIKKAGLSDTVNVVCADAKDYLPALNGVYDYIFLDGPKAHYVYMLDDCVRLLRKGGILVSDNILYKGMTASDELVIRRKITIVKRLREYISALCGRGDLETSIIPIGDGIAVSIKK
ncbi:MAG: O-methyltransferase [Oscillospiraceae bacterium]|nr:O-methyltransferase [Oscillospiraceae bacterium]